MAAAAMQRPFLWLQIYTRSKPQHFSENFKRFSCAVVFRVHLSKNRSSPG